MSRSLLSVAFLFVSIFLSTACQDLGKVPEEVKQAFAAKYPGEDEPDWRVDRNGNYEAHFKQDGDKYRADFSPSGKWVETERSIKKKELPDAVKATLEEKYKDVKIVELEWVNHAQKGIFYDVELKELGQKFDVEINEQGTIIGIEQ